MALEETDIWIGLSRSGKALNFVINDTRYTVPVSNVEKVIKGERKGTKLSKIVPDATNPAQKPEKAAA